MRPTSTTCDSRSSFRGTRYRTIFGGTRQNGITLLGTAAVLLTYGLWVPELLLIGTLPALVVVLRYTIRQNQWRLRNTTAERRAHYFDWILTVRDAAAELRLFGLGDHFRDALQHLRARLRNERVRLAWEQALASLGAGVFALMTTALALVWMAWSASFGLASLGDVALFYQAFNQGQRMMRTLLANTGQVYSNVLFLENLFEFLTLEPQVVNPQEPVRLDVATRLLEKGIRFDDVTFCYPGSLRPAIEGFSLALPPQIL